MSQKIINCQLNVVSNSNHLQQLYTGFELLNRQKKIGLTQLIDHRNKFFIANKRKPFTDHIGGLRVICNGKKLFYCTSDSHEISQENLDWCDIMFKRSYNPDIHSNFSVKIKALDLNYLVKPDFFSKHSVERASSLSTGIDKLKNIVRELDVKNSLSYSPRLDEMHAPPDTKNQFKVLFLVRLWEPGADDHWELSEVHNQDRESINKMRIDCVRLLQKTLGKEFVGGIVDSKYARNKCSDIIFRATEHTRKRNYIKFVKSFSVCIATTGLSLSIGWKFAEYIAFSKAIVSEKLHSNTFGNLSKGVNYLEFHSPEECVEKVLQLKQDKNLRENMMRANSNYYERYLKPENLIMNTLKQAITS